MIHVFRWGAKLSVTVAFAAAAFFVIHGCAENQDADLEPVTYRLKWLYNVSVAGGLYADSQGLFADQGLKVTLKEGSPERDAIKDVELGHAHFGTASADQVIRALSKGAPIVVVAQLFQVNPLQWMFLPDRVSVASPTDLKGKTIGVTFGGNDETIMKALMVKHGIPAGEVRLFSVRYDYTPFYLGEVDLWPVYQNAEGVVIGSRIERGGDRVGFFNPAEAGVHFVANSVVTTETIWNDRPDLVRRFVAALLQGWGEALDPANRDRAVATIRRFDRDTPEEIIEKQLGATAKLVQPSPDIKIGYLDRQAWQETERIMHSQGLIAEPVAVERVLRPVP